MIISAHGEPYTGTNLNISSGESIDLSSYRAYFNIFPKNMAVYVSACWGGYPSVIQGICENADNPPVLVAPLIPIKRHQHIEIQNSIIDCLSKQSDDYEGQLVETVERLNEELKKSYYGQPVVRLVKRDGQWIPGLEAASLAAPINEYLDNNLKEWRNMTEEDRTYLIVALQDISPDFSNNFLRAILYNGKSFWIVLEHELSLTDIFKIEDPYLAIDRAIKLLENKIHTHPSLLNIGQLTEVKVWKILPDNKIPDRLNYEAPYPHCKEKPYSDSIYAEMCIISSGSPCLVCNWAILKCGDLHEGDKVTLKIEASCRRNSCEARNL